MTISTDSIEHGTSTSKTLTTGTGDLMTVSTDSLEGNGKGAAAATLLDVQLGNGARPAPVPEVAALRPPPAPRGAMQASTDSLDDSFSARATTSMASSGTSETMVAEFEQEQRRPTAPSQATDSDSSGSARRDTVAITHGGQVSIGHSVTEVIRASRDDYGHVVERTVEQPADISRAVFRGPNSDRKMADYLRNLGEYEALQETEYVDSRGAVVRKMVVQQKRIVGGASNGGVDEETVEEFDEFGNVKKYVIRSSVVNEPIEVVKTIELISERPRPKRTEAAAAAPAAAAGHAAPSPSTSRPVRQPPPGI